MRIALVGPSNLGPYHLARYNALAAQGAEVHIAGCPVKEYYRPWEFAVDNAHFAVSRPFSGRARSLILEARAWLQSCEPDVAIVIGYNSAYGAAVASVAALQGIPRLLVLVGTEATAGRSATREIAKKAICRALFDGALVPGKRALEYALKLGIPSDRVWEVGNAVDNSHFDSSLKGSVQDAFVYVGRLSREKNLPKLLEAYEAYRAHGVQWRLLLAGDGPMRNELAEMCRVRNGVELLGWVSYRDLPSVLRRASALVLPSLHEPWGLVVNEAMASHLPVLVSRSCGCYPELCREGVNGFGFDPRSKYSISTAMLRLSSETAVSIQQMGLSSRQMVEQYSLERWSTTLLRAARFVLGSNSRK